MEDKKQPELFDLLEATVLDKHHLRQLAERGMPLFLRPGTAPSLLGVDVMTDESFRQTLPNHCSVDHIPMVAAVNMTRLYVMAGMEPIHANGWVLFFRGGLEGFLALGVLALETYRLRYANPAEEFLVLTDEQERDALAGAASTLRNYLPLYYIRILRSLWKSGVKV